MDRIRVGVIGCGNISGAYFRTMKNFEVLDVAACADLDLERAKARAAMLPMELEEGTLDW